MRRSLAARRRARIVAAEAGLRLTEDQGDQATAANFLSLLVDLHRERIADGEPPDTDRRDP